MEDQSDPRWIAAKLFAEADTPTLRFQRARRRARSKGVSAGDGASATGGSHPVQLQGGTMSAKEIRWLSELGTALEEAQRVGRPVLIDIYDPG